MEPDKEKIETLTKSTREAEEVILIVGVINATGKTLFWKNELKLIIKIGDYAAVENMNGYDLIKVLGIVKTIKKDVSKFSNTKYSNMKKVTRVLNNELVER